MTCDKTYAPSCTTTSRENNWPTHTAICSAHLDRLGEQREGAVDAEVGRPLAHEPEEHGVEDGGAEVAEEDAGGDDLGREEEKP